MSSSYINRSTHSPEVLVPAILGASTILYSVCTNYELGMIRKIPMTTHLFMDLISGVFLASSPWLFGFERICLPYLAIGAIEILIISLSSVKPFYKQPEDLST